MRFFIELSYDGTNYAGWQKQPNAPTIQGSIEDALRILYQKDIALTGCGRTDSGVHARHYIAHCDLPKSSINPEDILYKLNHLLSDDVAFHKIYPVEQDIHARYDAISRKYEYCIHMEKDPFQSRFSTYISYGKRINRDLLDEVAEIIEETKDFTSFCKANGNSTTMICKIYESRWRWIEDEQRLIYHIRANRFLRGMVRLIVGTSLNIATGKLSIKDLKKIMENKDRHPLMKSAPPQGLSLTKVLYK